MKNWLSTAAAAAAAVLALSACHHPPRTAAELLEKMPRRFTGEVHLQGDTSTQPVRIEARQLATRSELLLEFSGINVVALDGNGSVQSEHLAACRGTISTPALDVRMEELGGAEDVLKAGTFIGKLSDDLQTVEASWTTGFGTKGSLKLKATP